MPRVISYFLPYLVPYKFGICLVLLSLTAIVCVTLSLGSALQVLIDEGIKAQDSVMLNTAIIRITLLIFALGGASFIRSYFINSISENVTIDLRRRIYSHLLTLRYPEFEKLTVSDITSRLSSDMDLVSRIIIDTFSYCIRNGMIFIGGIVMMFTESAKLSFIVLLVVPLIILCLLTLSGKLRALSRSSQESLASLSEKVSETFQGIQAIYSLNAQEFKKQEFEQVTGDFLALSLLRLRLRSAFFAIAITCIMCSVTFVIWVGSLDVINGSMSPGSLTSFIFYAAYSAVSIGGIAEIFGEMQRSLAGLERVLSMLEIDNCEEIMHHSKLQPRNNIIAFQSVGFAYPSRPSEEVLRNISLNIRNGEFVAIVGPSGSGKSTIAQLLLGFFEPQVGQILICEEDARSVGPHTSRNVISYVPQNPFMFSGSIKENVVLSDIVEDEIKSAMDITGLDTVVSELPEGLRTYIGMNGVQISGGQRQRIALTRAILRQSDVLFLDEATSALDQASERLVMAKLKNAMQGRTIIAIAHRISSIQDADRILVVEAGQIVAEGTHQELLQSSPLYHKLCYNNQISN